MTRRQEQIESTLRKAVSECLAAGLHDPRVSGLISVTRVNVSPDLSQADIMVSILPEDKAEECMAGLKSASGFVRRSIGKKIPGKGLPRLHFRLDTSLKKEFAIHQAIDEAMDDVESTGPIQDDGPDQPTETP